MHLVAKSQVKTALAKRVQKNLFAKAIAMQTTCARKRQK
nr:MAG TPA: hypothetical protein [Caudoviricetes sp.]